MYGRWGFCYCPSGIILSDVLGGEGHYYCPSVAILTGAYEVWVIVSVQTLSFDLMSGVWGPLVLSKCCPFVWRMA